MAENKAQFANLEELFDSDLEDIADLPAFEVPPPGTYILEVTTDTKEINDKPAVEAKFKVIETTELKIQDESHGKYRAPVKDGTEFNIAFILGNEVAEGRLKQFLVPFAEFFSEKGKGSTGRLIRDHIKATRIAAQITNRQDKEDPERFYASIKNIIVA